MHGTSYGKRDFAGVIKLRIVKWEDHPGLPGHALNAITSVLRGRQQTEGAHKEAQRVYVTWSASHSW